MSVVPVILSGGAGTRLWPMSREACPKQFLPLIRGRSPFQVVLENLRRLADVEAPVVVVNEEHRFLALHQLEEAGVSPRAIYLEPCARNTAPAAGVVAFGLLREDPEAVMLVLPADLGIEDAEAFAAAVARGAEAARAQWLVALGTDARWPSPGLGFVDCGEPVHNVPDCLQAARFLWPAEAEAPARPALPARRYSNSGIYLFGVARFVVELGRLDPALESACHDAAHAIAEDRGCLRLSAEAFGRCRAVSLDDAVYARTDSAAVVPAGFRCEGFESWNALWSGASKDDQGNVVHGDAQLNGVRNSYVFSSGRMVAAIGVENAVIVETPDVVLVAGRREAARIGETVARLREHGRKESRYNRVVQRPWGCYEDVDLGQRFRVKRITVNPGEKLSLQLHHHRAEHWVVVSGTARVLRGEEEVLLTENQSTFIPVGVRHRLENPGKIPLQIVEVQSGAYLAEDDIVRIDDLYQRT
jgi:mannose-1-phosphate guanylyltransferase / mannose-6-phosphate isomerase